MTNWRKACKTSSGDDDWCVETAVIAPNVVGIRDSKTGGTLTFTDSEWQEFILKIKKRTLDL